MRTKLIALLMPATAILGGFAGLAPARAAGACQDGVNPANTRITVTNIQTKSFSDCTLSGITFAGAGGSITNAGDLMLTNVTISGSHSTAGLGGGAIYNIGKLTLNNVTITSSTAGGAGGAAYNDNGGVIHLNGVTIGGAGTSGNAATGNGGGILNLGTVDGTGLTILGNQAVNGGGVFDGTNDCNVNSVFNVTTGSISNNTATVSGGGAFVDSGGFALTSFTLAGNATATDGGGLYVNSANNIPGCNAFATIDKSTIGADNHAGGDGGGARVFGVLQLTNSSVQNNSATTNGGGVADGDPVACGDLQLANDTISGNTATNGGGISETCGTVSGVTTPRAPNLTISGNTATGNGGGVYAFGSGNVFLLHPTVADNQAAAGGGLWADPNSTIKFENALLARNTPQNCVGGSGPIVDLGGNNLDTGNTCQLAVAARNQVNVANPGLDVLADNFGPVKTQGLLLGSPAIDAVAVAACPPPPNDARGMTRPQATKCDIGAYECTATTPAVSLVTPSGGPPAGGTNVTITGTGFDRPGKLLFGTTPGVNVVINSPTQITATTPPGTGTEAITVQTCRAANPASAVAAFTFVGLPPAGQPVSGRGGSLPWAWLALAILLVSPALGVALLGRRRRVIS